MARAARLAGLISAFLVVSCASMEPEIRVQSTSDDLARLAGKWSGEYRHYNSPRRRGTIRFDLIAGEDHAHGSVIMTYAPRNRADQGRQLGQEPVTTRVLGIRFVLSRKGFVEGALEPYADPETNDQTWTTFHGEIKGDRIEGWFESRTATSPAVTSGGWRVTRMVERPRVVR